MDLTTDNILEIYDLPKFLDEWSLQQFLKPLVDFGANIQVVRAAACYGLLQFPLASPSVTKNCVS